jgi:hypothetical protein
MTLAYFRAFRTRGRFIDIAAFRRTVFRWMQDTVAPEIIRECRARVANWYTPPEFEAKASMDLTGIRVHVYPVGPGSDNWRRVSRGVEGHWIKVRKKHTFRRFKKYKPALRLNRYKPKTLPSGPYGFDSKRIAPTGYRQKVWWTGIRPRHFEEYIASTLQFWYRRDAENMMRRAVRVAQR